MKYISDELVSFCAKVFLESPSERQQEIHKLTYEVHHFLVTKATEHKVQSGEMVIILEILNKEISQQIKSNIESIALKYFKTKYDPPT